jgi:hypothetical protein
LLLKYLVLPVDPEDGKKTTNMTIERYVNLVETRYVSWREECFGDSGPCHLVQDHERCLWNAASVNALRKAKCLVVQDHPKSSPDLNAIENVWKKLRDRLVASEPQAIETRPEFLTRLRRAVTWLNEGQHDELLHLCNNLKERARAVLNAHPPGGKTKW